MTLHQNGSVQRVSAVLPRTVLAVLLLNADRTVSVTALADVLWGDRPPASARASVHNFVLRLRRRLGPDRAARLRTVTDGYLLEVESGELDLQVFTDLCRRGRQALAAHQWASGRDTLAEALGLWRGDPVADVERPALDPAERQRLEELRLQAVQDHVQATLQLGLHAAALPELRALTRRHPLAEGFHGQLMLALYRSGRPADALAAFQRARTTLADELGADPGPELQRLHQRILRHDPALDLDRGTAASAPAVRPPDPAPASASAPVAVPAPGTPTPRQLPSAVPYFVGRAAELRILDAQLTPAGERPGGSARTAPPIAAVCGLAATGKTALAVHWAQRAAGHFPDGQLYVNLRGFDPSCSPMAPAEALCGLLDALGVGSAQRPVDLQAQAALYRSLLAGRRMLVVLDNARDDDQVRPLLPGSSACAVLVTSRTDLTGLAAGEGAAVVPLRPLAAAESRELMVHRIGAARVAAEPEASEQLLAACSGLPLAVGIVAARVAARPGHPLNALAGQLRDAGQRLRALETGDAATDLRTVFSWSLARLSAPAARLFRLLGLLPGPHTSVAAAASLAGTPLLDAGAALAELARAHLVEESLPGRYTAHDLVRSYAEELAERTESDGARRAAEHRILDHYLHTAYRALRMLHRPVTALDLPAPAPGVLLERPADAQEADAWGRAHRTVLAAAVDQAVGAGLDRHAWQLGYCATGFLAHSAHWHSLARVQRTAFDAACRLDDRFAQALTERTLGYGYGRMGEYQQAHDCFQSAARTFQALGRPLSRGVCHQGSAWVLDMQGKHGDAMAEAALALRMLRDSPDPDAYAGALNTVGRCHTHTGCCEKALTLCGLALSLYRRSDNPFGQAETWYSIGLAQHGSGRYAEALAAHRSALGIFQRLGDRHYVGETLAALADAHEALGEHPAAAELRRRALPILQDIRHPDAGRVRARVRTGRPLPTR
ncbi:tetratricopeptide repeat protein [Streptacidiphilus sp. PB12-B1b]|uniref:AfsR/SARP family transcriptional regulator n=1 Tax=Streptacidiphilus sp. PB12-B1b TaxID=2705012 RepID=UPI0015FAAF9E|nr:BTAD domain-containing putative transcriptional regulator [Streptacidiphilus sp. PB12-B1b]QMU76646.1 tetratricopeptide repeat protein [Streptacidiphilus sp. PB12-B1b]